MPWAMRLVRIKTAGIRPAAIGREKRARIRLERASAIEKRGLGPFFVEHPTVIRYNSVLKTIKARC
jgi:hypothetical protein